MKCCSEDLTPEILGLVMFPDSKFCFCFLLVGSCLAVCAYSGSSKKYSVYLKKEYKMELDIIKLHKSVNCQ